MIAEFLFKQNHTTEIKLDLNKDVLLDNWATINLLSDS